MKKIFSIVAIIGLPFSVNAQIETRESYTNIFNVCATILVVALFMIFILNIIKRALDHRLKSKIVEKGVSEDVTSSLLKTNPKEDKNINIKWFAILAGIGTGLTIINYTLPLGIHSLAIIAFSIAASFLGYFFFLRQSER